MNETPNPQPSDLVATLLILTHLPAPASLREACEAWLMPANNEISTHTPRLQQKILRWGKQRHALSQAIPDNAEQWENFRKMLLSLLASPLVLLYALASHLGELRQFKFRSASEQQTLAQLTQSLFAPLANRLGLSAWKWEMEDIAFRLAQPNTYADIAKQLASKRSEREGFIHRIQQEILTLLAAEGIPADISGRPKHIYSIYKKMQRKSLTFEQLYDLHALRILTDNIEHCYRILGILHQHYLSILGEFDDYIACPKANGYQSIHTILLGEKGWVFEVQIRTIDMHQHAEAGIAAHWHYKEGGDQDQSLNQLVNSLREGLSGELDALGFEAWERELAGQHIVVLTPKGDLIRLTKGSTALDFAYNIHTDLGHACRGALVNGKIRPLDDPLHNGDRVDIISQKNGKPSLKWLSGSFLKSNRARQKVRHYFNRLDADRHQIEGRAQLDKLRHRFRLDAAFIHFLCERLRLDSDKILAIRIGQGKISSEQLSSAIQDYLHPRIEAPSNAAANTPITKADVFIPGIGRASAQFAQCCQPTPPSPIIGLLTRTHGLRVHRQDCKDLLALPHENHQRLLRVRWGSDPQIDTQLCLEITAIEQGNFLAELVNCLTKEGIRIGHFHTQNSPQAHQLRIHLELELTQQLDWLALMDKLESLTSVIDVKYCIEGSL